MPQAKRQGEQESKRKRIIGWLAGHEIHLEIEDFLDNIIKKSEFYFCIILNFYFINLFGANVNVGNISVDDVIPLETLRIGLRGDTFFNYLPEGTKDKTF